MKKLIFGLIFIGLAGCCGAANAESVSVTTKCEDGLEFNIFQTNTQFKVLQVINYDGLPKTCGDLKRVQQEVEAMKQEIIADHAIHSQKAREKNELDK